MKPRKIGPANTVYQTSRLTVVQTKLELADGTDVIWEYPIVDSSVVIVPVDKKNQVYLVREWRLPYRLEILQLPAGKCENQDERELVNQAQIELQQELGLSSGRLIKLGKTYASAGIHKVSHIYLAVDLVKHLRQPDKGELVEVIKMPIAKAYRHFRKTEASPAYTTVGLVWAMEALELLKI